MANQSINAVKIIPNDNINLPEPGIKTSGTSTTGTTGVTLKDSSNDFLNSATNPNGYNIAPGYVVYNTSTNAVAKVSFPKICTKATEENGVFLLPRI